MSLKQSLDHFSSEVFREEELMAGKAKWRNEAVRGTFSFLFITFRLFLKEITRLLLSHFLITIQEAEECLLELSIMLH